MSNRYNDMLADKAIDIVDEAMEKNDMPFYRAILKVNKAMKKNDTIPEEARQMLYTEEYKRLMEESCEN